MDALDGNAIAGELFAAFGHEMTAVMGTCTSCGARSAIAELRVYISGPGTVARCPDCASVAIVLAHGTARFTGYELTGPGSGRVD
jgi:ribosomal protein S27E